MEKDAERKTKPKSAGRGWSEGRRQYTCRDEIDVNIISRVFRLR